MPVRRGYSPPPHRKIPLLPGLSPRKTETTAKPYIREYCNKNTPVAESCKDPDFSQEYRIALQSVPDCLSGRRTHQSGYLRRTLQLTPLLFFQRFLDPPDTVLSIPDWHRFFPVLPVKERHQGGYPVPDGVFLSFCGYCSHRWFDFSRNTADFSLSVFCNSPGTPESPLPLFCQSSFPLQPLFRSTVLRPEKQPSNILRLYKYGCFYDSLYTILLPSVFLPRENRYWNQNIPQYTPGLFPRLPAWKTETDNVWLFPWFLRFRTLPTPDRHTALSSRR